MQTASKTERLSVLFFGLMFFGLFLGDGKQAVIEVYGAATTLILWFFRLSYSGGRFIKLPRRIAVSWVLVFAATTLSSITSDSVGFSLSWTIRLLSGYLLYRLFYDAASELTDSMISRSLLVLTAAASVAALVFVALPGLQEALPSMNLVSRRFGHNHLADLLVLVFPLVWNTVSTLPMKQRVGAAILYVTLLLLTLARIAWVIVSLFSVVSMSIQHKRFAVGMVVAIVCVTIAAGGGYFGRQWTAPDASVPTQDSSYMRPGSLSARLEYWRQAVDGFIARPITGNGPGTFSLVSFQHQRRPLSSSWFAHSQPLQALAEMGVLGAIVFGALVFSHIRFFYVHRKTLVRSRTRTALVVGCVLVGAYSLFEFVLDYLIVWLLLCAVAGFIVGKTLPEKNETGGRSIRLGLVITGVYYLIWISSNGVGLFTKRHDVAFFLAPFDSVQALLYLDKQNSDTYNIGIPLTVVFHKKNPQILTAIGKYMQKIGRGDEALRFSREAVLANPQDIELVTTHLLLLAPLPAQQIGQEVVLIFRRSLPARVQAQVDALVPYAPQIGEAVSKIYTTQAPPLQQRHASLLYLIGLEQIHVYPGLTERLWRLARDAFFDYAVIHIELAMYYQHIEHNDAKAQEVLQLCVKRESPREQCGSFLGKEMLPPGDFYGVLR